MYIHMYIYIYIYLQGCVSGGGGHHKYKAQVSSVDNVRTEKP